MRILLTRPYVDRREMMFDQYIAPCNHHMYTQPRGSTSTSSPTRVATSMNLYVPADFDDLGSAPAVAGSRAYPRTVRAEGPIATAG